MTTQSRITREARTLLQQIGATSMTMDMVARNCGISKRTLYETFPDKKTLIKTCLEEDHAEQDRILADIFKNAENCYDALFKTYLHFRGYMAKTSRVYLSDIKRLYPDLFMERREKEMNLVTQLSNVLAKAQEQGYMESRIDTRIAAFLFVNNLRDVHENRRYQDYGFNAIDVFDGAFLNFLRGISTIEGIRTIDAYLEKENKLNAQL